jgi:pyrophosphatase PpaX
LILNVKQQPDLLRRDTRAILFDLDGTLIDSTDLILQCFQHSWETVCGFYHSREALVQTFGTPLRAAMYRLLDTTEQSASGSHVARGTATEDIVDQLLAAYRAFNTENHDKLARPFEGASEVLRELRRRGYLIGVVTSKGRDLAVRGLKLCSLEGLIDIAVFLEDTEFHKPRPEPILAALKNLSNSSNNAAYVGDSPHDMAAARAAGVLAVAALWGPGSRTELERENPDVVAESIGDLLEVFCGSSAPC